MSQNIEIQDTSRIDALFERISALIEQARMLWSVPSKLQR